MSSANRVSLISSFLIWIPFIFLPRNKVKFPTNVSSMLSPCFEIENDPSFVYCISENMNNQSQEREVDSDEDYEINIGDKIVQGVFQKIMVTDDESDIENERIGGMGSTGK